MSVSKADAHRGALVAPQAAIPFSTRRSRLAMLWLLLASLIAALLVSFFQDDRFGAGRSSAVVRGPANPAVAEEVEALTREGVGSAQAVQDVAVQAGLNRTNLLARLPGALNHSYGGVWFDGATAKLHVGVTSAAGRRAAESLARRADLAPSVEETHVRSSWDALLATQRSLDRRLAGFLKREEVVTALVPQRNAVQLRVSTSLPRAKTAFVNRLARRAGVEVEIVPRPPAGLWFKPQARCAKFAKGAAYCNPTIVAGVSIQAEKRADVCSAGPAVLRRNLFLETTETFILTAGHCLKGGGVGELWKSWNNKLKPESKTIGPVVAIENGKADVGVIQVETKGYWATGGNPPVTPAVALWGAAESEPFTVPGEVASGVGLVTCISGEISGTACGTVKAVNVTCGERQQLVETRPFTTEEGDSGAPWWSGGEKSLHWIEGTHVGECGGWPVFDPLRYSFERLESKISLELLTTSNEIRPAFPMQ